MQLHIFQQFTVETDDNKGPPQNVKVIVVGDSLFNGISEKGFCKTHDVEVKNVLGGTTVPDEADNVSWSETRLYYNVRWHK